MAVLIAALVLATALAWNPIWYQDDQLPTLFRTFHTDLAHHYGCDLSAPRAGFRVRVRAPAPPVLPAIRRRACRLAPHPRARLRGRCSGDLLALPDLQRLSACTPSPGALLGGRWPAVLAAIGFVWAPYVLLDAHKGGVLGESIAMALMPWSLLALDRLVRGGGRGAFGASAGTLALVVLGHNITALFWVGLPGLYALLLAIRAWIASPTPATR